MVLGGVRPSPRRPGLQAVGLAGPPHEHRARVAPAGHPAEAQRSGFLWQRSAAGTAADGRAPRPCDPRTPPPPPPPAVRRLRPLLLLWPPAPFSDSSRSCPRLRPLLLPRTLPLLLSAPPASSPQAPPPCSVQTFHSVDPAAPPRARPLLFPPFLTLLSTPDSPYARSRPLLLATPLRSLDLALSPRPLPRLLSPLGPLCQALAAPSSWLSPRPLYLLRPSPAPLASSPSPVPTPAN
ncbi:hypothetical protein NN561_007611 [Cricetulus griseus]